ncbi:Endoplasmic reticulum membrane protein 65 [Candida viswanathii]|uniref:Endoplasmic reticulum membrane protein 65 n=1 Tax=Candida viswanathii TaxID=5486 RepID=A0A367XXM9_9ASCO|nr:Endoplasmic reticulum membrane protein 65 [Candida viswanathii]
MLNIPYCLEKFMVFGLLVCFNSFLTLFTLAPLKIMIITLQQAFQYLRNFDSFQFQRFRLIKKDVITLSVVLLSIIVLSNRKLDISRMYHDVRGQADIKLYVMFGVLECAEKLCSSLGQDILNILYQTSPSRKTARFVVFYFLSIFYLSFHAYILIYQTVSLNVAANSYSNALLTLLLSNQFAELKGSVSKI